MTALSRILGVTGALLFVAGTFVACGPQVVNSRSLPNPDGSSTPSSGNSTPTALGFTEVKALMDKSCNGAGCHTAPGAGGVPLDTLAAVKANFDASMVTVKANPPTMPIGSKPKFTADEIKALDAWKAAGFPEKAPAAGGGAPAPGGAALVGYAKDIAPLMTASCNGAGCHEGAAPAGGVDLTTLAKVQTEIDASIGTLTATPPTMPVPGTRTALTPAQVKLLQDWKAGGFKP